MHKFSDIAKEIKESQLQNCMNIPCMEEYISLGLGLPSPDTFPKNLSIDEIGMQYAPPSAKLKSQIKDLVKLRGIDCSEDEIFLTAGAQQAISLLLRLFCDEGDIVLCEELTYYGFVQAAKNVGAKVETIYQDTFSGIGPAQLEDKIKSLPSKPKLIYLIPNGHNPTAVTLSKKRRQEIAEIAAKYEIPIIEDDAYGFLSYTRHPEGSVADRRDLVTATEPLDQAHIRPTKVQTAELALPLDNGVFYISTFSKILAPSLRVGYMIVPKEFQKKLSIIKESADLNITSFGMGVVSKFLEENRFEEHLASVTKLYREKRDIMADAIDKHLSDYVGYILPESGIYFWLETVEDMDSMELHKRALKEKLIIMPGSAFTVSNSILGSNGIRLNFSYPSKEDIIEGIRRLGLVLSSTSCKKAIFTL